MTAAISAPSATLASSTSFASPAKAVDESGTSTSVERTKTGFDKKELQKDDQSGDLAAALASLFTESSGAGASGGGGGCPLPDVFDADDMPGGKSKAAA